MNIYLLEMKMKIKGKTNEDMARRIGVDPATFYRKKTGRSEFTRSELQAIRSELSLSQEELESIFFKD
ncbi:MULTISPECIES: helix-turn-helix domain-containing protein [Holdemania]|uniref:helix-turn-helix domain-containing protein n=1 Tax=Holdemania TaxID=61170 RepID=UPI0018975FD6|nr:MULTISPECIES: helix-turn-helix domain-containing protein [Holdemania]MCQ4953024.1 helix-turn-helix transcriptional regulator [Holdemania filiformis]